MKTKVKPGLGLYFHTSMAGTIVDGTGIYGGLPVSQYEGKAKLNVGTAGPDEMFWMLWRAFGDTLRATTLGSYVANSNTQPTIQILDIDLTISVDTWYFVLSNLKPDFRYLDCFETFVQYVNFYVAFFTGSLSRQIRPVREASPKPEDDEDDNLVESDDELTLEAIAEAFFDSAPVGECAQADDEFDYVIEIDQILEPAVRVKYPLGTPAPPGPSIVYDADFVAENGLTFRTLEDSMKYYEAAAKIIPRAMAIAAWGEYALKNVIDVRKTLSYNSLVFDFTNAVANFLYKAEVIGFADDIDVKSVDFVQELELPSEKDIRDADRKARQDARKGKEELPGQTPEEVPRTTRGRGGVSRNKSGTGTRLRTKAEKRVMREIETMAIILSRPGNMDKIEKETTQGRVAEIIDSSFGVRLQQLLAGLPPTRSNRVTTKEADLQNQKLNLEKAIRRTEESINSPGPEDDVEELQEDLDGLRNALTSVDQDIANIADEIKEEEYLNAYRISITQQPRAFLVDIFEQFERSVKKINAFVVKDSAPDRDDDDDEGEPSSGIGPRRKSEFFTTPGSDLTQIDINTFRPRMEIISDSVRRVQLQRLVLGPKVSITDINASGDKYYALTRTSDEDDVDTAATFIDMSGWVDLFSFLYSTGELFLDWQRKLALDIDIHSRLLAEEFFGLEAKPRATVSITNVAEITKGTTTIANIAWKVGRTTVNYKTRIQ